MFRRFRQARPGLLARSRTTPRLFADFYEDMAPSVFAFFRRETQDEQRALELTAETFAVAFENRMDFRGQDDQQGYAWTWKIAHSTLSHAHRTAGNDLAAIRRLGLERPVATDEELLALEREGIEEAIKGHLDAAMGRLSAEQQEVLHLRFTDGLSYAEIAVQLGVTELVARSGASRALRALRENHRMRKIMVLRQT
jgi:RNA polymerase sigma-70 factor (ECF subfamily)